MKIRKAIYTLSAILLGFLFMPHFASADNDYAGCDSTTIDAHNGQAISICNPFGGTGLSIYGIDFSIADLSGALHDPVRLAVFDGSTSMTSGYIDLPLSSLTVGINHLAFTSPISITNGNNIVVGFENPAQSPSASPNGDGIVFDRDSVTGKGYAVWYFSLTTFNDSTRTRFISFTPSPEETIATSTATTTAFSFYINNNDWGTNDCFRYQIYLQKPTNLFYGVSGDSFICYADFPALNTFSTTTALLQTGTYHIAVQLKRKRTDLISWLFPHLYEDLISTTTTFYVGNPSVQTSTFSSIQEALNNAFASSTADLANSCKPFGTSFSVADCLLGVIYPGNSAMADNFTIIKQIPPWGYVFRLIDILNASSTATSTLPSISYTFATSSPLAVIGDIHFDPFKTIADSGTLINEMKSDRADPKTIWEIIMPAIKIIVYLSLAFMIFHDLTGVHSHAQKERESQA